MAQKLILPFRRSVLSAGYKNTRYRFYYGYAHYGWDMGCDEAGYRILSPGAGTVAAAGMDGSCLHGAGANLGNCVVLILRDVRCPDGMTRDVACRMFHLDSIAVRAGQTVAAGTAIGDYGDTYAHPCGKHLHIEFDSDTRYPAYAVGVAQSGKIIKRGTIDSTLDPVELFHLADGQTIRGCRADDDTEWYSGKDISLPHIGTREVCPACGRELQ